MSVRRSTAQEILDAEGWIPCGSPRHQEIGSVITSGGNRVGIPPECKLVIVGTATIEEINALALRHGFGVQVPFTPFLYKAVAE